MTQPQGDIDFFISFRGKNAAWAKWIKWVLRSAGYTTRSMDEFPKGTEFTDQMREACEHCLRLIPLYSADYWQSGACTGEFDTYWNQHFGNKQARFLIPLEIEDCSVPDAHRQLLFESLHDRTSEDARQLVLAAVSGIVPTGTPSTDPEPPYPGVSAVTSIADWPDSVPALRWPLADHDEAREAFATLVTRTAPFQLLAIKGNSETGKSHLTKQFLNNAARFITTCRCGRLDLKGTDQIDEALKDFVQHLQVPQPPVSANLTDRLRHILQSLTERPRPSLLIFDTYEDAGATDRWVRESLLPSLHRYSWLRVVIAGQDVPPCGGQMWADDSKVLRISPPEPQHWHDFAQINGRNATLSTVTEVHQLAGGKSSILAQLFGPQH